MQNEVLSPEEVLELLNLAEVETPEDPEIYKIAFDHIQNPDILNNPNSANLNGKIALKGFNWKGYSPKEFADISAQRSSLESNLDKEQETKYNNGLAFLGVVGEILPTISILATTFSKVEPWNEIHSVVKKVGNSGVDPIAMPIPFINQVRKA